jgi:hypothetical protein
MTSKPVVLGLLAAACITAAAGGAYLAVRQNGAPTTVVSEQPRQAPATTAPGAVAETEAVVSPPGPAEAPVETSPPAKAPSARSNGDEARAATSATKTAPASRSSAAVTRNREAARPSAVATVEQPPAVERTTAPRDAVAAPAPSVAPPAAQPAPVIPDLPPPPVTPQVVEVVVPASSVIGLQVDTSITSETARIEDRVEAHITRAVMADGRVVFPAGTRAIGNVVLVELGGKMKDKARLGVRFHTLVLADGSERPIRTESIFREGSSPGSESARKIGGAAVGGAILGAILGGGKGAAIGGATGAAGGTAVVMAGDRNAATLPAGTIVTVHLSSPVTMEVEKEPQPPNQ